MSWRLYLCIALSVVVSSVDEKTQLKKQCSFFYGVRFPSCLQCHTKQVPGVLLLLFVIPNPFSGKAHAQRCLRGDTVHARDMCI